MITTAPATPCAVQDAGCHSKHHTTGRCFRCGRPACKACSVRTDFDRFGCQTLCHDCLLAIGKPEYVIRSLNRQGFGLTVGEAAVRAKQGQPRPPARPSVAQSLATAARLAVAKQMKTANRYAKKRASFLAKLRPEEPRPLPPTPEVKP